MNQEKLTHTAQAMAAPGKGILAADESSGTIKKRFDAIGVESTEQTREAYRNMLFATAGMENHISGVIMFDETVRQGTADGTPFPAYLAARGVQPGIKVDRGAKPLAGHPGETVTEGLDGLRERLTEYAAMGLTFAKWRAVITIGDGIPSQTCIDSNAEALARYAALCQEAGIVPIVEPEVLMDGSHTMGRCREVTGQTLGAVFATLTAHRVYLPGIILKPNMVVAGTDCPDQPSSAEVARRSLELLLAIVPADVPGIAFLSGGQTERQATANLQAMNAIADIDKPWRLTFSYGRALQQSALQRWSGNSDQLPAGQAAFLHRAEMNAAATSGRYSEALETGS